MTTSDMGSLPAGKTWSRRVGASQNQRYPRTNMWWSELHCGTRCVHQSASQAMLSSHPSHQTHRQNPPLQKEAHGGLRKSMERSFGDGMSGVSLHTRLGATSGGPGRTCVRQHFCGYASRDASKGPRTLLTPRQRCWNPVEVDAVPAKFCTSQHRFVDTKRVLGFSK